MTRFLKGYTRFFRGKMTRFWRGDSRVALRKKSTQEQEMGDCNQGSSMYVSSYSQNSYPYSILHYSLTIF